VYVGNTTFCWLHTTIWLWQSSKASWNTATPLSIPETADPKNLRHTSSQFVHTSSNLYYVQWSLQNAGSCHSFTLKHSYGYMVCYQVKTNCHTDYVSTSLLSNQSISSHCKLFVTHCAQIWPRLVIMSMLSDIITISFNLYFSFYHFPCMRVTVYMCKVWGL